MEIKRSKILESMIWPFSEEEHQSLEQRICQSGRCEPFHIWHDVLLDGFQTFQICQVHGIPFQTYELHFKNWEEVIIWVCKDQMRRPNLPSEMRKYLIGKRYTAEKILAARNVVRRNQYSPMLDGERMRNHSSNRQNRTAVPLGHEYHVCCQTIQKYGAFASAIDRIISVDSTMHAQLFSGEIGVSHDNVIVLAGMNDLHIKLVIAFLRETNKTHLLLEDLEQIVGYTDASKKLFRCGYAQASVKDMPAYDPDTEVLSLALTIPSWCTSVRRLQNATDLNAISESARDKLCANLRVLQDEIAFMKQAVKKGESHE